MVGEGTTAILFTFLLAIVGYAGLTTVVVLSVRGPVPFRLWRVAAAVILVHVVMVWTYRYGGQFSLAVRNGYAGFAMFHTALLLILVSTVAGDRRARILIHLSFAIVSMGALGAAFLYEVVAIYQVPVIFCAAIGGLALIRFYLLKRPPGAQTTGP